MAGLRRGALYPQWVNSPDAITRLVWNEYGKLPFEPRETDAALREASRRLRCRATAGPPDPYRSFTTLGYRDSSGHHVGTLLLRQNMVALVHPDDTDALMTGRRYLGAGRLWDALSATGQLLMLGPEWLSADLTAPERQLLLASPDAWEAYSVRYWKPQTRGDALFNGWD